MTVRIVTDSTCDLPRDVVKALGVTVVPLSVHFDGVTYRDGVDMTPSVFFLKLASASVLPTTSQPSGGEFASAYQATAKDTDQILSIHVSAKLSGTYNSALVGRQAVDGSCRIEIIDSRQVSMGLGLTVMAAARAAQEGQSLDQIADTVRRLIPRAHLIGAVESLEYLHKGGRIGKARVLLGSLLGIKPIITCQDGEACALGRERTRPRAMERLFKVVEEHLPVDELAILHSNTPLDAEDLANRLAAIFPRERMVCTRFGPVLGTYLGPGAIGVAFIDKER